MQNKELTQLKNYFKKKCKTLAENYEGEYDEKDIWQLYETCEFDMEITENILQIIQKKKYSIHSIVQQIVKNPNLIKKNLQEFEKQSFKLLFLEKQQQLQQQQQKQMKHQEKEEEKKKEIVQEDEEKENSKQKIQETPKQHCRIIKLSYSIILMILDFLNIPYVCCFAVTNSDFLKYRQSNYLYKKFCSALYKFIPTLPEVSVFQPIQQYILSKPAEYDQILRLRVQQNIRQVVWDDIVPQNLVNTKQYYQQFGNYYSMYMNAPRINFCGIYYIKEKYVKIGEKDLKNQYAPILTIYYYRYIRFFPSGKFKSVVTVKKFEKSQIINLLSEADYIVQQDEQIQPVQMYNLQNSNQISKKDVMRGEFVLREDLIIVKYNCNDEIFHLEMNIKNSEFGKNDQLVINSHKSKFINQEFIHELYSANENESKFFSYLYIPEFRFDISDSTISRMSC